MTCTRRLLAAMLLLCAPAASPGAPTEGAQAQQHWKELKRDLEKSRDEMASGRITTYRLGGTHCQSRLTQRRSGADYEAVEESVTIDWAELSGVEAENGWVINAVKLIGESTFTVQLDGTERVLRVERAIKALVAACRNAA